MRTSAAALAPSPVSQPFESRWCWSWCCVSSAYGTNSFLGALVVSRVLGRQDRFPRCVAVPCWSRSRHGVQGRWPAADTRESRVQRRHTQETQADQLTPHTPDHGGIGAVARDHRVAERAAVRPGVALQTSSSRDTALVSAQNQRRLPSYAVRLQTRSGRCCARFTGPPLPPRGDPAGSERGASTRRSEDELGDQTSEACPPQDESPPAKVG